jgi:adenosylcobinamide-GDP ribazoletransferase
VLSALAFLTVAGGARRPDERTLAWFPVVGAVLGGAISLVWLGSDELWPAAVAAAVVVAADLGLTGLLHADGLADSADGLLPHLPPERRLAVMSAPDVGGFALAVVPAVLLLRWSALATGAVPALALVAVWAASRTVVAAVPALVPYAREQGLASAFLAGARTRFLAWLAPAGVVLAIAAGWLGIVALVALVGASAAVVALARRRIGGFTGDVLGAVVLVGETAALLALAVDR